MLIVDASLANKLFLPHEAYYLQVENIFRRHLEGVEEITVPDLIFYEVGNTLATKSAIPQSLAVKAINLLYEYSLTIYYPSQKDIENALILSKKHHVSVYDSIYAVLAGQKKCILITADERFIKQVKLPFVKHVSAYTIL